MMTSLPLLFVLLLASAVDCGSRRRSKSTGSRYGKYGNDRRDRCPSIKGFFSYDPKSPCGPQHWHKKYPKCGGDKQSPIDIQTDKTSCGDDDDYRQIYYSPSGISKGIFENNGHAPNFEVKKGDHSNVLILGEDEYGSRYDFKGLHFHIGRRRSSYGSEHTVNNEGYKGEIHLVHKRKKGKKTKDDDDNQEENGHINEYLVIGVFFDVVDDCGSYADKLISKYVTKIPNYLDKKSKKNVYTWYTRERRERRPKAKMTIKKETVVDDCGSYADKLISKYVTKIPNYLDKKKRAKVQPSLMLPEDGKYYYYIGSKTTPGCDPGVLWMVYKTTTTVCKKNYKVLQNLETWEAGNPPLSKFGSNRPIQRYNVDDVKTNFGEGCRETK